MTTKIYIVAVKLLRTGEVEIFKFISYESRQSFINESKRLFPGGYDYLTSESEVYYE